MANVITKYFVRHSKAMIAKPHQRCNPGFTTFEVLVAALISFIFLSGTLNTIVLATILQVKAERKAQANFWIQEDLEAVRAAADNYSSTAGCNTSTVGSDFESNGLPGIAQNPKTLVNVAHLMVRTETPNENVVELDYTVFEDSDNDGTQDSDEETIAQLYTEVLPKAALTCP